MTSHDLTFLASPSEVARRVPQIVSESAEMFHIVFARGFTSAQELLAKRRFLVNKDRLLKLLRFYKRWNVLYEDVEIGEEIGAEGRIVVDYDANLQSVEEGLNLRQCVVESGKEDDVEQRLAESISTFSGTVPCTSLEALEAGVVVVQGRGPALKSKALNFVGYAFPDLFPESRL